jgi:site-specific DNA-methyltransferase (adenine-specific)
VSVVRDGPASVTCSPNATTPRTPPRIAVSAFGEHLASYLTRKTVSPIFMLGEAEMVLRQLPAESFDFCMTSPPYWGKRVYANGGIGLEPDFRDYIAHLCAVFGEVKRVLKPTGSFWLNIGDSFLEKRLMGIPGRVAFALMDVQGWILRDCVIWNKIKGGLDNSVDRLRNTYEPVFHFVKQPSGYYFDADAIRANPRKARVVNGAVVSATGVTGIRYKRQLEMSTALEPEEKQQALKELGTMLGAVQQGQVSDFRMIIRGQQRATHSDAESVSGRARELNEKGFYFLKYHPNGSKPADVWDILPEDTQGRHLHFAPYPVDLCRIPMRATCPPDGIALDPFCGTGTTMLAAMNLNRKSVGIDIAEEYLRAAEERCSSLL